MDLATLLSEHEREQLATHCGVGWLQDLPERLLQAAAAWQLGSFEVLARGHNGLVLACRQEQALRALKVPADRAQGALQARALRAAPAGVAPDLLGEHDGMLLMERLLPGTALSVVPAVTRNDLLAVGSVLSRLHARPAPTGAGSLYQTWAQACDSDQTSGGTFWAGVLAPLLADPLMRQLHGDAHLGNVAAGGGLRLVDLEWLAGDPDYDLARLCMLWPQRLPGTAEELLMLLCTSAGRSPVRAFRWARLIGWGHSRYLRRLGTADRLVEADRLELYARSPIPTP